MSDPLSSSYLGELPNAGYSTRNERELSDAEMFIIRGFERDRMLLLEIVIQGFRLWRKRFVKSYRCIGATEESADQVFSYLVKLAGPNPEAQKAVLEQQQQQQSVTSWDKRLRTMMKHAKDRQDLQVDIVKESLKPRRVYS